MKRTILCSTFAVVALATAVATQSAFASRAVARVASMDEEGQSCTLENGRSGYMVSTGRGTYECVQDIEVGG